jgi:pimeloyl-ACP methyl ester carboxylesterase
MWGCAHIDVRLENFMTPDRGTRTAKLVSSYTVENRILLHEGRSIGITYAHHPKSQAIILFCGGDAFHRSLEGGEALEALASDTDVVLFDYPGYGDTEGLPNVDSILDTATAVYDAIFELDGTQEKKRIFYGFSMGGMVAAHLAQDRRADGVVLEATPPSVSDWVKSRVPMALKPIARVSIEPQLMGIDTVAALEHFRGKLLVLSSPADQVVPNNLSVEMADHLRQAGRDITSVQFPRRGHGAINRAPNFHAVVRNFIGQVRPLP